ncbi:MAG TPA: hypothetical protein VIW64_10805 [Pyrinomonadaceae bacterium]|jgi:hypothetical protein
MNDERTMRFPLGVTMITKEGLEQTIRAVIHEFKQAKRIPEPAAEELTAALEAKVEDLFERDAPFSYREIQNSSRYVEDLRGKAQLESSEKFLEEILAWQQTHSS